MSDQLEAERTAPDVYENGPEGMPRVKRMPGAVLDCIIDHSLFRYLGGALEGEDRDRLHGLMHDTANEALARVSAWPVAPAVGEDGLPPLPEQHEELRARWKCEDCDGRGHDGEAHWQGHFQPPEPYPCGTCEGSGWIATEAYTAEQVRQAQRDAVEADRRILLSSVPDRWKDCTSAVGAVQSYIAELEAEIADLRTQLARQSQGVPVAYMYVEDGETYFGHPDGYWPTDATPLYAAPMLPTAPQQASQKGDDHVG